MELRQLTYFVSLADTLSFSRASELLYISQSTLSKNISALEDELHVILVTRNTHSVFLTAAGAAFLKEARQVLAQADHAVDVARSASFSPPASSIRLGIDTRTDKTPSLTSAIVKMLNSFSAAKPGTKLEYKSYSFQSLWTALQDDEVDVAIMLHESDDMQHYIIPQLNSFCIYTDPLVLVLPEQAEVNYNAPLRELLQHYDTAYVAQRHSYFSTTGAIFKQIGISPMVRFCESWAEIVSAVSTGKGFTYCPYQTCKLLALPTLHPVHIPGDPMSADIVMRWKKKTVNSHIQELIGYAQEFDPNKASP